MPQYLSTVSWQLTGKMLLLASKASMKLAMICGLVVYMIDKGRIPRDASRTLAKVAFNITIPCLLMTKTAQTLLTSQGDLRFLMVPVAACCQIAAGSVLGKIAADWAVKPPSNTHEDASRVIASSVAAASGVPASAPFLASPSSQAPPGLTAVIRTACAFSNALTLPLLFLLTLFPASMEASVTGCTALYLMGWSPLFWTYGLSVFKQVVATAGRPESGPINESERTQQQEPNGTQSGGYQRSGNRDKAGISPAAEAARPAWSRLQRPMRGGAIIDVNANSDEPSNSLPEDMSDLPSMQDVDTTTSDTGLVRASDISSAAQPSGSRDRDGSGGANNGLTQMASTSAIVHGCDAPGSRDVRVPMTQIADPSVLPPLSVPVLKRGRQDHEPPAVVAVEPQPRVRNNAWTRRWRALRELVSRILNPPLAATLIGLALGSLPLGALLLTPTAPHVVDIVARLPWELTGLLEVLRSIAEVAALLGSATLVVQGITLGASLLPQQTLTENTNFASLLRPANRWEWRQLAATCTVRLLLMPIVGLGIVHGMTCLQWLPDAIECKLAILVQSCMPSAQNLVLLVNLSDETKHLAPALAQLLLRQYLIAIVPMTLWVTVFLIYLGYTPV